MQTEFEDREHWLTSTVDAIIARPRSTRPVVAEVKNIGADAMNEMMRLLRGPSEEHVRQIKCEIGLAHEHGPWHVMRCINSGRLAINLNHAANGNMPVVVCPEHGGTSVLRTRSLSRSSTGSCTTCRATILMTLASSTTSTIPSSCARGASS